MEYNPWGQQSLGGSDGHRFGFSWKAGMAFGWVAFLVLLCLFVLWQNVLDEQASVSVTPSEVPEGVEIPLPGLSSGDQLALGSDRMLDVNGQLRVNSSVIISPSDPPAKPVAGQIYYDDGLNVPMYYDGEKFVEVGKQDDIKRLQSAPKSERVIVERVVNTTTVVVNNEAAGEVAIPTANSNGNIVKFGPGNTITNSLLTESGSVVSVAGVLSLSTNDLQFGSGAFVASLNTVPLSANQTVLLPDESGTVCLQNSSSCGFMTGTPTQFIQNQNTAAQTATNFWVAGTGRADGGVIAPSIDTGGSGTLTIGSNATAVDVNADTKVNGNLGIATDSSAVNIPLLQLEQSGSGDATIELKNSSGSSFYIGMDQSAGGVLRIGSSTAARTTSSIGNTAAGGIAFQNVDSQIIAKKVTTGADAGSLSSIVTYLSSVDQVASGVKVALYSHDVANDRPGSLIAATSTESTGIVGWNIIPLSATINSNTTYWIAVNVEGGSTGVGYDYCGGCAGRSTSTYPRPFNNAWPATHGVPNNVLDSQEWSLYMRVASGGVNDTFAGAKLFSMTDTGSLTLQNGVDSTSAFQVQDAAGATILNLNTVSGELSVQDVTLEVNKSLTISGGVTGTRPANPSEGMIYYDTTEKRLITFANGKWQADRSDAVLVASADSTQSDKDAADHIADGNTASGADGDQVQINTALSEAAGRKVVLLAGTYTLDSHIAIPNNTILAGSGPGTRLTFPDGLNTSLSMIFNQDSSGTGAGIVIQDMTLDGNAANQAVGSMSGISLYRLGLGSGAAARSSAKVANVVVENMRTNGVHIEDSSRASIAGITARNNGGSGINMLRVHDSTIVNNISISNSFSGISLNDSRSNTISSNITKQNAGNGVLLTAGSDANTIGANTSSENDNSGIQLQGSSASTVSGNAVHSNSFAGITVQQNANDNIISSNKIFNNGTASYNNGVFIWSATSNQVTNNSISDDSASNTNYAIDLYDASVDKTYVAGNTIATGAIHDMGTATILGGQIDSVGGYSIQPGGTIQLLQNTNIDGDLTVDGGAMISGELQVSDIDTSAPGTLTIGGVNATTVDVGNNAGGHTVNIATGVGSQIVNIGSTSNSSGTYIQGGSNHIIFSSSSDIRAQYDGVYAFGNRAGDYNMVINAVTNEIVSQYGTSMIIQGALRVDNSPAVFNAGITIGNSGSLPSYTTPLGAQLQTAINIPNYTLGGYGTLLAFGLDDTTPSTARGLLVADARSSAHQPTIGVLSPNESDIFGFSWDGDNGTARLKTLGGNISLQLGADQVAHFSGSQIYLNKATQVTGALQVNGTGGITTNSGSAFVVQNASYQNLLIADTNGMKLTVRELEVTYNLTVLGDVTVGRHLRSSGSTPTTVTGPSACITPSVTVSGTDTSGLITVIAGTGCGSTGAVMAVTFANAFAVSPKVTLTPATASAANLPAYVDYAQVTTTSFDVATATPLADGVTYRWYYHVIE